MALVDFRKFACFKDDDPPLGNDLEAAGEGGDGDDMVDMIGLN